MESRAGYLAEAVSQSLTRGLKFHMGEAALHRIVYEAAGGLF